MYDNDVTYNKPIRPTRSHFNPSTALIARQWILSSSFNSPKCRETLYSSAISRQIALITPDSPRRHQEGAKAAPYALHEAASTNTIQINLESRVAYRGGGVVPPPPPGPSWTQNESFLSCGSVDPIAGGPPRLMSPPSQKV